MKDIKRDVTYMITVHGCTLAQHEAILRAATSLAQTIGDLARADDRRIGRGRRGEPQCPSGPRADDASDDHRCDRGDGRERPFAVVVQRDARPGEQLMRTDRGMLNASTFARMAP